VALAEQPQVEPSEPSDDAAFGSTTTVADYGQRPVGEVHDALQQMLAVRHSVDAEIAKLTAAGEDVGLAKVDGATGMGAWLTEVGRLSISTANTYVWVGRSLARLPHLAQAFSDGLLSLDQMKPAIRFVTPETDEEMARRLPGWSVRQIEDAAREARALTPKDADKAHDRRHITFRDDPDAGGGHITGFLPAEQYAATKAEIIRRAEQIAKDPATGLYPPWAHRLADAFADTVSNAGADRDPQDPAVVVHVDQEVLDGISAGNGLLDGIPIARDTVLRLACALNFEFVVEAEDGTKAVGIGRLSRHIPRWLRRLVVFRDGRCRFPGCGNRIKHLHHCTHWSPPANGETNDDNLIGLCWAHHRLVHEGGWSVRGDPRRQVTFVSPDGRRLSSHPDGLRTEVRRRLYEQRRKAHGLPA